MDGRTNRWMDATKQLVMASLLPLPSPSHSDRGTEFSQILDDKFKEEFQLEIYLSRDTVVKNSIVEIGNRLLQDRLYKNMQATRSNRWINHLGDVVKGINNMKRKVLFGFSSSQVKEDKNVLSIVQKKFLLKLHDYNNQFSSQKKKFKVGDSVKIVRKHTVFQRGYTKKTEDELAVVKRVLDTAPPTYLLEGKRRPYYGFELIRYNLPSSLQPTDVDSFEYYIEEVSPVARRQLRSGESRQSNEHVYKLKSRKDANFEQIIDDKERLDLIRDGRLPASLSGQ